MAKAAKKNRAPHETKAAAPAQAPGVAPGAPTNSYLAAAYFCFDHGDAVRTRYYAQQVLDGKATPADADVARKLSAVLTSEVHPVKDLPEDVAAELILRTKVPGKPYGFALVAASIFALLLTLALTRYGA